MGVHLAIHLTASPSACFSRCVLAELVSDPEGPVHVMLDEGGLRCVWKGGAGYIPFAALADANLDRSFFGRTLLMLVGARGEELRFPLENANALSVVGAIWREITDRRARARSARKLPASLARNERSLDVWLESLSHLTSRSGYREASIDVALLAEIFADDFADVEARSAAAFVLLAAGEPDALKGMARVLVLRALPPLVLVAVRLAPGGAAIVSDEVLADLRALLPHEDRDAVGRAALALVRDARREGLLAQALAAATTEAIAEAEREKGQAHEHGGKRLHVHPSADASSWVGRSWAL